MLCFQYMLSTLGEVFSRSFCRPMRAISLLKLPHRMYVWFGYVVIKVLIVCCIIGINLTFSLCVGMYRWNISCGCNGWFFIWMICKYGGMFIGVSIFVILLEYAYLVSISISNPPLAGVYGILC